jgi:hypothetical protein
MLKKSEASIKKYYIYNILGEVESSFDLQKMDVDKILSEIFTEGGRPLFRRMLRSFAQTMSEKEFVGVLERCSSVLRCDDLLTAFNTPMESCALKIVSVMLVNYDNCDCGKWLPREKRNPDVARKIARYMSIRPSDYRKLVSGNVNNGDDINE